MIRFLTEDTHFDDFFELVKLSHPDEFSLEWFKVIKKNLTKMSQDDFGVGYYEEENSQSGNPQTSYIEIKTKNINRGIRSGAVNFDFVSNVAGQKRKSSGISYMSTHPAYRGMGYSTAIIKEMLKENYNRGFIYSYLFPFSPSFYKNLGYGTGGISYKLKFNPKDIIKNNQNKSGGVKKSIGYSNDDIKEYIRLLNIYGDSVTFGVSMQSTEYCVQYFKDYLTKCKLNLFLSDDFAIISEFKDRDIIIHSLVYEKRGIIHALNFLSNFSTQANNIRLTTDYFSYRKILFLLKEQTLSSKAVTGSMARIINLKVAMTDKFHADYYTIKKPFEIHVKDDIIKENNRGYSISLTGIREVIFDSCRAISIDSASALILGCISVDELMILDKSAYCYELDSSFFSKKENLFINFSF